MDDEPTTDQSPDNQAPQEWDVIVLGGGPAGENAAQYAIQGSDRTAVIVESELVGGECSYWACMPSKALLRPLAVLDTARNLPGLASIVGDARIDNPALLARRDDFTSHLDDSSQVKWANSNHIDVVRGHGRLSGERLVSVTATDGTRRTLRARHAVVLATGTTAQIPPVDGLADALPWTSRDVTNLHEVPDRVAIIGTGVVACEAATWLQGLGVSVTLIGATDRVLARVEPFASEMVEQRLVAAGVVVHNSATVERVRREAPVRHAVGHINGGAVTLTFNGQELVVDEVLVAAGRVPQSKDIGLERVGLDERAHSAHGYVETDDQLAVEDVPAAGATPWLYAVGDLNGRSLLTHMGKYQARIAGAVIAARAEGRPVDGDAYRDVADDGAVPQVTFTIPEVASVGRTEAEARAAGIDVETVSYDLGALAGSSLSQDHFTGRAFLLIDRAADVLIGATFVGPDVADLLHAATLAVVARVPVATLWHVVPSYPTVSEIWLRLLETLATQRRDGSK